MTTGPTKFEPLPAMLRRVAMVHASQRQQEYIAKLEAVAKAAASVVQDPSKLGDLQEAIAQLQNAD